MTHASRIHTAVLCASLTALCLAIPVPAGPAVDFSDATVEKSFEASAGSTGEAVTLWLDLTPGTRWSEQHRTSATQQMEATGAPMPAMNPSFDMTLTLESAVLGEEGSPERQIESVVQDGSLTMMLNGQPVNTAAMGGDPMAATIGTRTVTTVDELGNAVDMEEFASQVFGGMGGGLGDAPGGLGQQFYTLPDRPVRPGDTWIQTLRFNQAEGATMTMRSTLDRIESQGGQPVAVIQSETRLEIPNPVSLADEAIGGPPAPGATLDSAEVVMTSEARHLVTQGRRGSASADMKATLSMSTAMPGLPPQTDGTVPETMGMKMTMDIHTDVAVEYLD